MGILVSVIVGVALTLPISSAAICAALTLTGLAGGAAVAGCCANMVGFAVLSVLLYIAGLMCSHLAAFRIATNLRLALTEHIARLPLGQIQVSGSGKLRRTIADTAGAAETFLAHQLPDQYRAMATVAGLLVLLLAFDWRLGLLSLVPVVLAFLAMTSMTGKKLQDKMTQY